MMPQPENARILIVDDTLQNIQVLGTILREQGYQLNVAQNGKQALESVQKVHPDLILLDVMMPEMDGFETCQHLKADPETADIPVIFLTAKIETDDIVKGFELGAVDYVTKPFTATELLRRARTHLELSQLRRNLEQLVDERTEELAATNRIYSHFVPREFLLILEHDNILGVQLGDQVRMDMTILFSDIVSFTELSEKMDPGENFRFLNAYLSWVSPIIRQNGGFIDKYVGDAIMALFPGDADDALQAAVEMQRAVTQFNADLANGPLPPIAIGIGLHTGSIMLGVIGEAERMDTTVISDAVNVASRLEALTRRYEVGILLSEDTLKSLPEENEFNVRRLEKVQVKGKNQPITVFEAFDGDAPDLLALKQKTRPDFEEALELYYKRQFTEANLRIAQILAVSPADKVVHLFQQRIALAIANGVPADWTGIEILTQK
mgnify:FL=1